jgi:hypothetical protein
MLPIRRAGLLKEVRGAESAAAVPGVNSVAISIPGGHVLRPLPEGDRYLGFIFARGETPEAVEAALRTAEALIDVDVAASAPATRSEMHPAAATREP